MKITYYGHATIAVEFGGKHLLFDPFISGNPIAPAIAIDEIPADYILISHGHQDHVLDMERIAQRTHATVISNAEIVGWAAGKGLKGHAMNHGGKWNFDFGTVKYVNAVHSSSLPDGSNGGNPGGFVIWNSARCFYFSGDTALTMDMKLIPELCPRLDIAMLPIGDNFTMGYEEAIIASDFIHCNRILGIHYDTFGLIKIDHQHVLDAFKARGKELVLLPIGKSIEV
ncbi:MAG: metal-dependent hydrolase [Saprospirales bacterium]|nr:metal-dependent hydrolase [Saprospirales bacterium]